MKNTKTIQRFAALLCLLVLVMGLLSTCNGGFNLIMYNHLKKSDSYITCTATVTDISRPRNGYPYLPCVFHHRSVPELARRKL